MASYLVNQSDIVNLDNIKYKLSVDEKSQIWTKYTSDMSLSGKDYDAIFTVDMYFPLLCSFLFSKEEDKTKGIGKTSPLYIACQYGHDSIVQLLLKNKAVTNICTKMGACPLFIACKNGHLITVKLLLYNRADFNLCKKNKVSPLYLACQTGHNSTVKLLLDIEADINSCTKTGASPLIIACQKGQESTVQI